MALGLLTLCPDSLGQNSCYVIKSSHKQQFPSLPSKIRLLNKCTSSPKITELHLTWHNFEGLSKPSKGGKNKNTGTSLLTSMNKLKHSLENSYSSEGH